MEMNKGIFIMRLSKFIAVVIMFLVFNPCSEIMCARYGYNYPVNVGVNGYLNEGATINIGHRVFVHTDPQVNNPLLDIEKCNKIKQILIINGLEAVLTIVA